MADNESKTHYYQYGPGFLPLLTLLFIYFKVHGDIDWTWIWVLSPLWIGPLAVIGLLLIILFICALIAILT